MDVEVSEPVGLIVEVRVIVAMPDADKGIELVLVIVVEAELEQDGDSETVWEAVLLELDTSDRDGDED